MTIRIKLFILFFFLASVNAVNGPTYGYDYNGNDISNTNMATPATTTDCDATQWRDSAYRCQGMCFNLANQATCCAYTFFRPVCFLKKAASVWSVQVFGTIWSGLGPKCGGIAPILWLRVDSLSSLADGAKVSSWPDSSMRVTPATQSSPSKQPTYLKSGWDDGSPTVYFDGIDDVMNGAMSFPSQATVIAVFKDAGTTTTCCSGLFVTLPTSYYGIGLMVTTNGLQVLPDCPGCGTVFGEVSNVVSTIVVTYTATTTTLHVNGMLLGSFATFVAYTASTSFAIGSRGETAYNRYTKGFYKEVIVYGSALSDADRNSVLDEILSRVAVPMNIYVNHDNAIFKLVPPATDDLFSGFTVTIS